MDFISNSDNTSHSFFSIISLTDSQRHNLKNGDKLWFKHFVDNLFQNNHRAILIKLENENSNFFTYQELHQLNPNLGQLFGKLLEQNEAGDKTIVVYDRIRTGSMSSGARYHQTREGGSIHTDNVNIPSPWEYLFLSCLAPAHVGGENIIVDGFAIHDKLKNHFPEALAILREPFVWEMRGVSDALYEAPIITYDQVGAPLFRHLRPYMESAHIKAKRPLTEQQLYSLDVLDALTNSSELQIRYKMQKGDILITKDAQVLHGRTCFSDALEAVSFPEYMAGKGKILKRTMERLWIKI